MSAAEALLEVKGLSKRFGGVQALNGVFMTVAQGEICGVIGPNGAGKSTLFNLIAGGALPSEGSIHFGGIDVTALPMHKRARIGIARTFQLAHTFETMSVAENIMVGAEEHARLGLFEAATHLGPYAERLRRAGERTDEAMKAAGITHIADVKASDLTFGQQRLVATARALAAQPRLLLLDEPAAGLSTGDIGGLCAAIRQARANGTTVLIVEHNMDVIMQLCDHLVVMHLGEKIGDGTPAEIQQSERVLEAYLGT